MGNYLRPHRLEEALGALQQPFTVLAGGTDFYPARVGRTIDEDVLDIGAIADLRGIAATSAGWRLGATATWGEVIAAEWKRVAPTSARSNNARPPPAYVHGTGLCWPRNATSSCAT